MTLTPSIAMILAAGRGTRMRHLTDELPKPLIQVNGQTLLDRIVEQLLTDGVRKIVANTYYKGALIADALQKYQTRAQIVLSPEQAVLETGGGVLNALPLLLPEGAKGFFVINADTVWVNRTTSLPEQLSNCWQPQTTDILLALVPKTQAHGEDEKGNYFIEDGRPRRIAPTEADAPYFYIGAGIVHPRAFAGVPLGTFSMRALYDKAQQAGRLGFLIYDGDWFHVGTPEALAKTEQLLREK